MRAALHVLATIVVLPYVVLACAFLLLGHAISRGTVWSALYALMEHFVWIVPWGAIGFAFVMLLVAVLGVIPRFSFVGALCLCVLAGASLAVIVVLPSDRIEMGHVLFLLPCMLVLAAAVWLAVVTR